MNLQETKILQYSLSTANKLCWASAYIRFILIIWAFWAALGLGALGDVRGVGPLLQSFSDEDEVVRDAVASSLGDIGEGVAVPALIDALGDEDWSVRHSAALALGKIGDDRAVEPLMLLQEDENLGVQYTAALGIRMITGENVSGCSSGRCKIPR